MNEDKTTPDERLALNRASSLIFSYLLAAVLLGALIYFSGVWNFLANTRLLDLLIDAGVVKLHDDQTGFVEGVPDLGYYLKSQDPVNWYLVQFAGAIFLLFFMIKAVQFHLFALNCGIPGTFTWHARAYLPSLGVNHLLPFNLGNRSLARAPEFRGVPSDQVSRAVFLGEIFLLFEILAYATIGLFVLGWSTWFGQMFWGLVILGICYWFVKPNQRYPRPSILTGSFRDVGQAIRALSKRPVNLLGLGLLSLVAIGLEDIAAYVIAMAFTSQNVILHIDFSVLLMAVVASYIARLIPVTAGGIGQFEWGFAAALYVGGLGFPECVTIAVLDNVIRYASGTLMLAWVYFLRADYAFELFTRGEPKAREIS